MDEGLRATSQPLPSLIERRGRVRKLTPELIKENREAILEIARYYGASDIRVFGSVARGDATDSSDLDLVVKFETGRSLLDQGGLMMDLRDLLGIKVDVVSAGALSGRFGEIVRKEAVPL